MVPQPSRQGVRPGPLPGALPGDSRRAGPRSPSGWCRPPFSA